MSDAPTELSRILSALTHDNRKTVEDIARKLLTLQNLENPDARTLEDLALTDFIDDWTTQINLQGKSPRTTSTYRNYLLALLRELPQPTPQLIEAYLAMKMGSGSTPASICARIAAYDNFFRFLTRRGILLSNPAEQLSRPRIPRARRESPEDSTVRALLALPIESARDNAVLRLLVGCGIRVGELISLQPRSISIPRSTVSVIGKGRKPRTVPMPAETATAILLHLATIDQTSTWLFPGRHHAKHITDKTIGRILQALCQRAEVPVITAHQLRHYYVSALLAGGVPLATASQLAGHAGPDVTARVYCHDLASTMHQTIISQHNPFARLARLPEEAP